MIDDLRRYRALAIALCLSVVFAVCVFVVFLQMSMERSRIAYSAETKASSVYGQAQLNRFFDHTIGLVLAETTNQSLIQRIEKAGLLPLVQQVCEHAEGTINTVIDTREDQQKNACLSENHELIKKIYFPKEHTDNEAYLLIYNIEPQNTDNDLLDAGSGNQLSLVLAVNRSSENTLLFDINLDTLINKFRSSRFTENHTEGQYCLSLDIEGKLLSLKCTGQTAIMGMTPGADQTEKSLPGDNIFAFNMRGTHWQLLARPYTKDIASDVSATPFMALTVTIILCGLNCWFVYHAVDKAVKLDKNNSRQRLMVKQLEKNNQDLDQFATMAAHDLQAPLRFIASSAYMLQEEIEEQQIPELYQLSETIIGQSERMKALILDLLSFCRAGQEPIQLDDVDVRQLIDSEIERLASNGNFSSTSISIGEVPSVLQCDNEMFTEIIRHLLNNAIKFSQNNDSPEIAIEAYRSEEDHSWIFCLKDNGCGIKPESLEKVFRPFTQLNATQEGTGIGLSIVRKLVERHNGNIWIDSTINAGTAVMFTMPENLAELAL